MTEKDNELAQGHSAGAQHLAGSAVANLGEVESVLSDMTKGLLPKMLLHIFF